jgi:hypothetical protein
VDAPLPCELRGDGVVAEAITPARAVPCESERGSNCDTASMAIGWVRLPGRDDAKRSGALNASGCYEAGDGAGADRPAEPLVEGVVLGAQSVALPG